MKTLKRPGARSPQMLKVDSMMGEYITDILNSVTSFHKLHLQITGESSYSRHIALNELYDTLPDLIDTVAEGYQGACEVLLKYPDKTAIKLNTHEDAISLCRDLCNKTKILQDVVPHSEVVNNMDLIKDALNKAKYKLKFLS